MDRGSVLSGAAFTAVLMSAVTFLVVLITVGVLTNGYVERSLVADLREEVDARWNLFDAGYREEGVGPLTELIASAVLGAGQAQRAVGLFDAKGTAVAGNILSLPAGSGWQQGPLEIAGANSRAVAGQKPDQFLYRSGPFGDHTLVVGQGMDRMARTHQAVFRTLASTGFVVVLTMLAAGYFLSRKSQHKLESLEAALARVSDGDLSARMQVSRDNDQIDRISERVNAHLETLSRAMLSTRSTAAAIAHDLKSPLARAYLGLGRALERIEAGQDPQAEIEDTQAELERMNAIFDSFMRLSRIEAGSDGARFAPVDLGALLDDLAETYQMVAEDAGQSLIFDHGSDETFVILGDMAMVQQMVVNLLQNAVTHGGPGNEIHLTLDHRGGAVRMSVCDRGPGIPEAARAAVFEPFHRLDPSRNRPGSGLGLALVRAIAERHGARVSLSDNAPGLRVDVVFSQAPAT